MKKQSGFTVIELLVIIVLFVVAGLFFLQQKEQIARVDRDRERKTAVNAFHYSLEEVYYKTNNSYPRKIDAKVLPSVDPELFKDPNGIAVGTQGSNYHYDALDCQGDSCSKYEIRAELESEDDFTKKSNR